MSQTPKQDKRPKYNNDKAFEWVDSQWEKFMTEQKEHKAQIKNLKKELKDLEMAYDKLLNEHIFGTPTDGLEVGSPEDYEIDITTNDRIEYLKSEIAHGNYHDGWTLEGLKEQLKELEEKSNPLQLELFND